PNEMRDRSRRAEANEELTMKRWTLCATLMLAAAGCDTRLDGGGNEGGGGGAGATTVASVASGLAVTCGDDASAIATGTASNGSGGSGTWGSCSSTAGLPDAQLLFGSPHWFTALGLHGDDLVAATEQLDAEEAQLFRYTDSGSGLVSQDEVPQTI